MLLLLLSLLPVLLAVEVAIPAAAPQGPHTPQAAPAEAPIHIEAFGVPPAAYVAPLGPDCVVRVVDRSKRPPELRALGKRYAIVHEGIAIDAPGIDWVISPHPTTPHLLSYAAAPVAAAPRSALRREHAVGAISSSCRGHKPSVRGRSHFTRLTRVLEVEPIQVSDCEPGIGPFWATHVAEQMRPAIVDVLRSFSFLLIYETTEGGCSYPVADQFAMALEAGTVPVFFGDERCLDAFAPSRTSVIHMSDFDSHASLAVFLSSFEDAGPGALAMFAAAPPQKSYTDATRNPFSSIPERLCAFARREHSVERIRADGSGSLAALLRRHADPNTRDIIAFFTNLGFADFTLNVKAQLEQLGITNYIVFALDPCGADMLARHGLGDRIYYNETDAEGLSAGAEDYMAPRYKTLVDLKVLYAEQIVGLGYNVLVSDVDTLWFANPFDHIPRDADIAAAVDLYQPFGQPQTAICMEDRPYRVSECKPQDVSTGFYYVRATAASLRLLHDLWSTLSGTDMIEQVAFNHVLTASADHHPSLTLRFLPIGSFPAGMYFFDDPVRTPQFRSGELSAVVMHANFRIGHANKLDDCQPHMALDASQMDELRLESRFYEGLC